MTIRRVVAIAVLAATAMLPAVGSAKTFRTSYQLLQFTPSRVWRETSWIPFALPDPIDRVYRYRIGSRTFVGQWIPASASRQSASVALAEVYKDAVGVQAFAARGGVIVDRSLTVREKTRFKTLADLYSDADVLVVAPGHPACAGLTRTQARSISTGGITRWSQVVAGATSDTIKVRYLVDGFGNGVPHLGVKLVGRLNKQRFNYPTGAVAAADGGVSAAAGGDRAIAAITTWSRVRTRRAGLCIVPLNGVAPTDATVVGLQYPEAFPVSYVVTRKLVGRGAFDRALTAVMRRAMKTHLTSERLKGMLRGQGLLVVGDPLPTSTGG